MGSIDPLDWATQKAGITSALKTTTVVPVDGSIAVAVVQFSEVVRTEVPYTVIRSQADVDFVVNAVTAMVQLGFSTNPGDGIVTATDILRTSYRTSATQSFCLVTDGIRNDGVLPADAIAAAKASVFGLDRFGVIGIPDGTSVTESDFKAEYGSLVFPGNNTLYVLKNFAEFASSVGFICFPLLDTNLVGLEVVQVVQDLLNSVPLVRDKVTMVRAYFQPVDSAKSGRIQVRATNSVY